MRSMARADVMVLGAGIVGTCIAAHLAKRGIATVLIDRQAAGEGTSYGNAGIIEGNTIFPAAFPSDVGELVRIALKRSPLVNYHLSCLPRIVPWLMAFRAASTPKRLVESARVIRPLMAQAGAAHDALARAGGAARHFNGSGWLKVYRSEQAFAAQRAELDLAAQFGISNTPLDRDGALALEPA